MKTGAERWYSLRSPKRGRSWETPPPAIPEDSIAETVTAEVAVIGGGFAGLAAGARCAQAGLSVVIADKAEKPSAADDLIGAVDSSFMQNKGVRIDKAALARDWLAVCGSRVDEKLLWLYLNRSGEALDWLLSLAGDRLEVSLQSGYQGSGFDSRPGAHYLEVKPGCEEYVHSNGGLLACEILEKALLRSGGRIDRSVCALQLEKNGEGRVTGFLARGGGGRLIRYVGTKAVLLAAGDISGDEELLETFCPLALKPSIRQSDNTGDGHRMAYWAGAALEPPQLAAALGFAAGAPEPLMFLHVNRLGKRFMNEDTWPQAKAIRCMMQPGGDYAWTVMDAKWPADSAAQAAAAGAPACLSPDAMEDFLQRGLAVQAASLEELAEKMDVPAENLLSAVTRCNVLAAAGEDSDFGKRKELLTTVEQAPFYALRWTPAVLGVYGGVVTDQALRVLTPDGDPIGGLYAVGDAAGGLYGVDYPQLLGGSSYGRALTWALVVCESILGEKGGMRK